MKKAGVFFATIAVIAILLNAWWQSGLSAVNASDKTQRIFVIEKGAGVREIANKLKREGFIKDPVVFFLFVKKQGLDGKIQAGDFRLSPSQKAGEIAENLTHGTLDVWVTIVEGQRAEEIADTLEKKMPTYQHAWRGLLVKNEGYLFPDTYLFPKDADIDLIIRIMKDNFEKKFISLQNNSKLSKQEIVTIASLVEREARFAKDRFLVASVILNRYNIGMKLDIDATLQYALGYQRDEKTWWKRGLTNEDKTITSLYNTYIQQGLPPTPICNPGLAALHAVVNPTKTDYLYYISDKKGNNHYAETFEEHTDNINKFGL